MIVHPQHQQTQLEKHTSTHGTQCWIVKKITSSDIQFAIPRRNWSNGTVFDMYKHNISSSNTATSGASNLFDSTFYFMTSDFRVYKVLDNNGGTAFSGSEPTSESTSAFALVDMFLNICTKYL